MRGVARKETWKKCKMGSMGKTFKVGQEKSMLHFSHVFPLGGEPLDAGRGLRHVVPDLCLAVLLFDMTIWGLDLVSKQFECFVVNPRK